MIDLPKMPSKVHIGGMSWSVLYEDCDDNGDYGQAEYRDLEIKVFASSRQLEQETLMHEILHAIFFVSGIEKLLKNEEEIEQIVSVLSNPLWQTLKDNPKLVEYWTSK